MTRPGIEPRSSGPLMNPLLIRPMAWFCSIYTCIYINISTLEYTHTHTLIELERERERELLIIFDLEWNYDYNPLWFMIDFLKRPWKHLSILECSYDFCKSSECLRLG